MWIGFRDVDSNDVFKWMTGDVVGANGYTNWVSGGKSPYSNLICNRNYTYVDQIDSVGSVCIHLKFTLPNVYIQIDKKNTVKIHIS